PDVLTTSIGRLRLRLTESCRPPNRRCGQPAWPRRRGIRAEANVGQRKQSWAVEWLIRPVLGGGWELEPGRSTTFGGPTREETIFSQASATRRRPPTRPPKHIRFLKSRRPIHRWGNAHRYRLAKS